jgi:Zn-dependent protease/CBS domain-containing protein
MARSVVTGRGVRLGTILGIPIAIHYSWLFIVALLTAGRAVALGQSFPYLGVPARLSLGLAASVLLFGSVLAHELSHALVAIRHRVGIRSITLFVFGGAAEMVDEPSTARAELEIAVAGPAMSLALGLSFGGIQYAAFGSVPPPFVELLSFLATTNLLLVVFNLVPGFPLDGGRVLRAALWGIWGSLSPATRVAGAVGSFFGGFIILLGVVWVFSENPIGGLWFVLIGLFLRNAAQASQQQLQIRQALEGVRVRDLISREAGAVGPGTSIAEVVESIVLPTGASEIPVVDEGRLVGILRISDIRARERSMWPFLTASDLMSRDVIADAVTPDEEALKILGLLGEEDRVLPVVEGGEFLGVVTRRDVLRRLQIRMELFR